LQSRFRRRQRCKNHEKPFRFNSADGVKDLNDLHGAIAQRVSIVPRPDHLMRANYFTYFKKHHCSPDAAEFNALKIMKKDKDLTS